jgi:hypothetical protein
MDRTALFDRLEANGGTLVARNDRAGTFVILSQGSVEEGAASIAGCIPLAAVGPDGDLLADRGWQATDRGLEREWPVRSSVDRSAILRDVDDAIDILSDRRGLRRADFPLAHVAPLSSDAGNFQIGCIVAVVSALVGNALATVALLLLHPAWLFGQAEPIGAIVGGLVGGWVVAFVVAVVGSLLVVGVGVMSLIERVPRLSRVSADIFFGLMIVVPAVVAAITLWSTASANR